MTRDPERLLTTHGEIDAHERDLLTSLQQMSAPADAKDAAWNNIAAQLALGAGVSAATAAAAPSAAAAKSGIGVWLSSASVSKVVVTAAVATCVAYGGYVATHHAAPPATQSTPRKEKKAIAAPAPVVQAPPMAAVAPAPADELVAPIAKHAHGSRIDRLRIESARLSAARAQLRAGHPAAAEAILTRLRNELPDGVLLQEREVLMIDVLAAEGNTQAAHQRARTFVASHPSSPHAAKLGRFLVEP